MFTVALYARIRRAVMIEGLSRREAAQRFGVHRNTIAKMLLYAVPPGYRRRERPVSKKLQAHTAWIDGVLESDKSVHKKQHHTAHRIFERQLAFGAFQEVGPGKHFFGCSHTMANYTTAFWESAIADNNSFEQWRDAGQRDAQVRANSIWKRVLRDYQAPALDIGIDEALREFVARRKNDKPDQWH